MQEREVGEEAVADGGPDAAFCSLQSGEQLLQLQSLAKYSVNEGAACNVLLGHALFIILYTSLLLSQQEQCSTLISAMKMCYICVCLLQGTCKNCAILSLMFSLGLWMNSPSSKILCLPSMEPYDSETVDLNVFSCECTLCTALWNMLALYKQSVIKMCKKKFT